jgi:hypothetical protein
LAKYTKDFLSVTIYYNIYTIFKYTHKRDTYTKVENFKNKGEIRMQMIMNIIKETLQILIAIWIIALLSKYILRKTLLGKIITLFAQSVFGALAFTYGTVKKLANIAYADTKKFKKYIDEQCKKFNGNQQEKIVVNQSNNVIKVKFKKTKKHE